MQARLKASTDASKYGAPSAAVVARVVAVANASLVRELSLVACFLAVCFALRKRSGVSGRKVRLARCGARARPSAATLASL